MITNFQELGEVLAEFENRLSYLENSQPLYYDKEEKKKEPRPVVRVNYQANGVDQLPAFGSLQKQIDLLKGRLSKYFGDKLRKHKTEPF